jgi:hypothetical protein
MRTIVYTDSSRNMSDHLKLILLACHLYHCPLFIGSIFPGAPCFWRTQGHYLKVTNGRQVRFLGFQTEVSSTPYKSIKSLSSIQSYRLGLKVLLVLIVSVRWSKSRFDIWLQTEHLNKTVGGGHGFKWSRRRKNSGIFGNRRESRLCTSKFDNFVRVM